MATTQSTSVSPFNFGTHAVRVVMQDDQPWFVAHDVCHALEYSNASKAIADHLDDDERSTVTNSESRNGGGKLTIINESGLYALVLRSRKPEARKFAKWVTSEVLPSIRKTGQYTAPAATPSQPHTEALAMYRDALRTLLMTHPSAQAQRMACRQTHAVTGIDLAEVWGLEDSKPERPIGLALPNGTWAMPLTPTHRTVLAIIGKAVSYKHSGYRRYLQHGLMPLAYLLQLARLTHTELIETVNCLVQMNRVEQVATPSLRVGSVCFRLKGGAA